MEPKVIYEDEDIIVLDKPAGITVNKSDTTAGEETVQDWVEKYLKIQIPKHEIRNKSEIQNPNVQNNFEFRDSNFEFMNRAGIVHRIDKETSGILIVAKTLESFTNLQAQFKERKVKKTYMALVHGKVIPENGEINVPVGRLPWNRKRFGIVADGKEAATKYKVIRCFEIRNGKLDFVPLKSRNQEIKKSKSKISHFSLLELYPETGRTHQIRVHLKYLNHPIFADPFYAGRKTARNDRKILPRVFLHAFKISFFHPRTGLEVCFESQLPNELKIFLSTLNKEVN